MLIKKISSGWVVARFIKAHFTNRGNLYESTSRKVRIYQVEKLDFHKSKSWLFTSRKVYFFQVENLAFYKSKSVLFPSRKVGFLQVEKCTFSKSKIWLFTSRKVGFLQVENGKTCMILEKSFLKQTARHTYCRDSQGRCC